jgi:hypothetical protein
VVGTTSVLDDDDNVLLVGVVRQHVTFINSQQTEYFNVRKSKSESILWRCRLPIHNVETETSTTIASSLVVGHQQTQETMRPE